MGDSSSKVGGRRSLGDAPPDKTCKTKAARMAEESMPANNQVQHIPSAAQGRLTGYAVTLGCSRSPYLEGRTSLHTPLFCPYFSFPGSTPLQTNLKTTPAHRQGLCITHLQLTSDCPDLSNEAPNCKAVAAAAPLRVSQGNTLGVTAIGLTSPTTS